MTVGISLSNGIEAIVVTDTRASTQSRHSDMIEKSSEFKGDLYCGTLFGSGVADLVLEVFSALPNLNTNDIDMDQYAAKVQAILKEKRDATDNRIIAAMREDVLKRANIFQTEEKRKAYIDQETGRMLGEYEARLDPRQGRDPMRSTNLILVGYDKKSSRVRKFMIYSTATTETFTPQLVTGSGSDGADLYFNMRLQGLNPKHLSAPELLFHALNAFAYATVNEGVGGMPKVVHVDKDGVTVLPREGVAAVSNLCNAYLAEFDPRITRAQNISLIGRIALGYPGTHGEEHPLETAAALLEMNAAAVTTMAIPYSTWQERANVRNKRDTNGSVTSHTSHH